MAKGSQVLDLLHRYHHPTLLGEMSEYEAKAERRFLEEAGLRPTRPLSVLTAVRGLIQKDITRGISKRRGFVYRANVGIEKNNLINKISALSSSSKKTDKYGYRSPDIKEMENMMRGAGMAGVSYLKGVINRARQIASRSQTKPSATPPKLLPSATPPKLLGGRSNTGTGTTNAGTTQTNLDTTTPKQTGPKVVKVVRMFDPDKLLGNDGAKKLPPKTGKVLPPGSTKLLPPGSK